MENFSDYLKKWVNSSKYKSFQEALEQKKENLINLKINKKKLLQQKKGTMTREELESVVDTIIYFDSLTQADKDEIDWIVENNMSNISQKTAFFEYTKNLINWYFWLNYFLSKEDFEMAAKLRDVIEIEVKEFKYSIMKFCEWFDETDLTIANETNTEIKKMFLNDSGY